MELEFLKTIQLVAGCIVIIAISLILSSLPLVFVGSLDFGDKIANFLLITASVAIFSFILWFLSTGAVLDKEKHERSTVKRDYYAARTTYNIYGSSSSDIYHISIYTS